MLKKTSNRKQGNDFEEQLCEILFNNGFWVHNLAQNKSGQPADIIAVKRNRAYLIDCKVCSNGRFSLARVEPNQDLSMEMWRDCGNGEGWFAVKVRNQIFMMPHCSIKTLRNLQSYLDETEIHEYGTSIDKWF